MGTKYGRLRVFSLGTPPPRSINFALKSKNFRLRALLGLKLGLKYHRRAPQARKMRLRTFIISTLEGRNPSSPKSLFLS